MEFCIMSPVGGLNQYATLSKTHLVLAQVKNEEYRKFYRERGELGDFLMLDNGAYEEEFDPELLLEAMRWYKPNVVVLPDIYLGDWKASLQLSIEFAKENDVERFLDPKTKLWEWMFVPQAEPGDEVGWEICLDAGLRQIKPAWIGLSRNMVNDKRGTIFSSPLARVLKCYRLKKFRPLLKVHALGMQAGCLEEVWALNHAGCDSIDSSCAVWRGHNDFLLDDKDEWPDIPLDVDVQSLNNAGLIDFNINEVLKRCR